MKIALLTDGIWPYVIGGMQKHSYLLCKYLLKSGVQVDLYYTVKRNKEAVDLAKWFSKEELSLLNAILIPYPFGKPFPGHYIKESYNYSKLVFEKLAGHLEGYDLVYIQGFSGWHLLERKSRGLAAPPCILNFHGLEMFQYAASFRNRLEQQMFRPFVKRLLQKADYVQSLGGRLTDILMSIGIERERIWECGIGIEEEWISSEAVKPPSSIRTFVFIGRYERRKGIEELQDAITRVLSVHDARFHFIGPVPEDKQLASQKVVYHGLLKDSHDIQHILDDADVLVCPSYAEGMPTVILEAMARGCAVIATNVGAVSEEVTDHNGWLISARDGRVLYNALVAAITASPEAIMDKKRNAFSTVETFTWAKLVAKMTDKFEQLIKVKEHETVY